MYDENTLKQISEKFKELSDLFTSLAEDMDVEYPWEVDETPEPVKTVTLEEIRAVLASVSQKGMTSSVRELLHKYGANKLSEVKQSDYPALMADAEKLNA